MMPISQQIVQKISKDFVNVNLSYEFTDALNNKIELFNKEYLLALLQYLKYEINCAQLIDVCGVDYLHYGVTEWATESATVQGFSRAIQKTDLDLKQTKQYRFAVVYNLMSLVNNYRIRVKCFLTEEQLTIPSVVNMWPSADWYEREIFDLFGIYFSEHPNLKRLLTDYDFKGHPFRKDFPLGGDLEVRFDGKLQKVIYEPSSIETKVSVPKVIRKESPKKTKDISEVINE